MFRTIQRYLALNFIFPFWVCMAFFISFLVVSQLFRVIRHVANKSVSFTVVFEMIGYIALSFIPVAAPLAVFFATIFALNKLSQDSEVIAMRSFGYSKFDLFKPFMIMGALIGIAILGLNQNLIPASQQRLATIMARISHRGLLAEVEPEKFFTSIPNVTLFAEEVGADGSKLNNIFIKKKAGADRKEQVIFAQSGVLIKQKVKKDSIPSIRLHLMNGNITTIEKNGTDVEKLIFKEYDFPIMGGKADYYRYKTDRMRTTRELLHRINKYDARGKTNDRYRRKAELEFWSRFNIALLCMVFILLGFSLGIKKGRGANRHVEAIGFSIIIGYYSLLFFGMGLTRGHILPGYITIFTPTFVVFFIAIYFYRRLDWIN